MPKKKDVREGEAKGGEKEREEEKKEGEKGYTNLGLPSPSSKEIFVFCSR
jgi:hypothetical protein